MKPYSNINKSLQDNKTHKRLGLQKQKLKNFKGQSLKNPVCTPVTRTQLPIDICTHKYFPLYIDICLVPDIQVMI